MLTCRCRQTEDACSVIHRLSISAIYHLIKRLTALIWLWSYKKIAGGDVLLVATTQAVSTQLGTTATDDDIDVDSSHNVS